jgi:isochorismate synthase
MRCFLGATPERLLAKSGLTIETEAMAGSVEAGERKQAALLSSSKDLSEHVIVVREIVREIESLCARISFPESPAAHALRDVVHLYTPIHAELAQPCHVLELVERLHPTPAVGGVPRGAAVTWISEHEPNERGYYASPVGWFDEDGNGAFWVGLRSALLDGAHAHLYAGAGIVAGSDARQELAETELKLAALKSALGALP